MPEAGHRGCTAPLEGGGEGEGEGGAGVKGEGWSRVSPVPGFPKPRPKASKQIIITQVPRVRMPPHKAQSPSNRRGIESDYAP